MGGHLPEAQFQRPAAQNKLNISTVAETEQNESDPL